MPVAAALPAVAAVVSIGSSVYSAYKSGDAAEDQTDALKKSTKFNEKMALDQWNRYLDTFAPLEDVLTDRFLEPVYAPDPAKPTAPTEPTLTAPARPTWDFNFQSLPEHWKSMGQYIKDKGSYDKAFSDYQKAKKQYDTDLAAYNKAVANPTVSGYQMKPIEKTPEFSAMMGQIDKGYSDVAANTRRTLAGRYENGAGMEDAAQNTIELERTKAKTGAAVDLENNRFTQMLNLASLGRDLPATATNTMANVTANQANLANMYGNAAQSGWQSAGNTAGNLMQMYMLSSLMK